MKIFSIEDETEAVYVQLSDLNLISSIHLTTLKLNKSDILHMNRFVTDSNKDEFVRFDNKDEVDFFKSLDFIIDYTECSNLTTKEIDEMVLETSNQMNSIRNEFNQMTTEDKLKNYLLKEEFEIKHYKLNSLKKVSWSKNSGFEFKLPEYQKSVIKR